MRSRFSTDSRFRIHRDNLVVRSGFTTIVGHRPSSGNRPRSISLHIGNNITICNVAFRNSGAIICCIFHPTSNSWDGVGIATDGGVCGSGEGGSRLVLHRLDVGHIHIVAALVTHAVHRRTGSVAHAAAEGVALNRHRGVDIVAVREVEAQLAEGRRVANRRGRVRSALDARGRNLHGVGHRGGIVLAAHALTLSFRIAAVRDCERTSNLPITVITLNHCINGINCNGSATIGRIHCLHLSIGLQLRGKIFRIACVYIFNISNCTFKTQRRRIHRICVRPILLVGRTVRAVAGLIDVADFAAAGHCFYLGGRRGGRRGEGDGVAAVVRYIRRRRGHAFADTRHRLGAVRDLALPAVAHAHNDIDGVVFHTDTVIIS